MGIRTRCDAAHGVARGIGVLLLPAVLGLPSATASAQLAQEPLLMGGAGCSAPTASSLVFSSSVLGEGTLLVQSGFDRRTWEGYVRAYRASGYLAFVSNGGTEPAPVWTATFPGAAERNIHTSSAQRTAVPFAWCSLSDDQRSVLDAEYAAAACPVPSPPIFDYLRGDSRNELRFGGAFRDRPATVLGDVVNSQPLYSRAADHAYHLAPAASFSASGLHGHALYQAFVAYKRSGRVPTVAFGANDGMFHVLDARVGEPTSGRELFAYVPRAAFARLPSLADPAYEHRYAVDGPVIEGDIWTGTAWRTILIGTTGAGPAGIFAVDATAPDAAMDGRSVMWDITPADHASAAVRVLLGHAIGAGVIGSVRLDTDGARATEPNGAWAYIVGNGYESRNHTAALLVFNAMDGSLIRAIDTGVGNASTPNGLGAVTPLYDGNRNIIAVYAGDKLGNLWKFDLGSPDPGGWRIFNEQAPGNAAPLFIASEGGMTRSIHQAPRVLPHSSGGLIVAFATGKYFEVNDPYSRDDQGIFVLRDTGLASTIAFGDLALIRTEEYSSGSEVYRRLYRPDLADDDSRDIGYWVRLRPLEAVTSGERVISPLVVDAGVLVVTTFAPDEASDGCPAGQSTLYRIDLTTGFSRASFPSEDGTTIGRQGGADAITFVPLYRPPEPASPVATIAASELASMLAVPSFRVSADGASVQRTSAGSCLHAGARLDGSVVRVETRCAGLLPLRAWRPMK